MSDPYRPASQRLGGSSSTSAQDRVKSGVSGAKDRVLDGFTKLVDAAEGQIHRAPADIQPAARKAVAFSRERPVATMVGLAAVALLLARGQRSRH